MLSRDRHRVIWCTPGVGSEGALVGAVRDAGWTIARHCVDAADVLGAAAVEPEPIVVVSAGVQRVDPAVWSEICTVAKAVMVIRGQRDMPVPRGNGVVSEIPVEYAVEALPKELDAVGAPGPRGDTTGRVIAVWGTAGAPGRTTVAIGLAESWARRGLRVCLIDGDTYGPAIAQSLAVVEPTSGLLLACKHAEQGSLDEQSLVRALRSIRPGLDVLTGLDDSTRWPEVRSDSLVRVLDLCRSLFDITVVDIHDCIEVTSDPITAMRGERNGIAREVLGAATGVVSVARPDPVGAARLVRAMANLSGLDSEIVPLVVLNRLRRRSDMDEVRRVLARVGSRASLVGIPEDGVVTRAAARGSLLGEIRGRSRARAGFQRLAQQVAAA